MEFSDKFPWSRTTLSTRPFQMRSTHACHGHQSQPFTGNNTLSLFRRHPARLSRSPLIAPKQCVRHRFTCTSTRYAHARVDSLQHCSGAMCAPRVIITRACVIWCSSHIICGALSASSACRSARYAPCSLRSAVIYSHGCKQLDSMRNLRATCIAGDAESESQQDAYAIPGTSARTYTHKFYDNLQ